jgi:hypothetical protein
MSNITYQLSRGKPITKQYRKKPFIIGHHTTCKIKKNKVTGKERSVGFPILDNYGVDDITSMVEWLVELEFWKVSGNEIKASEFSFKGDKKSVVKHVENNNLVNDLKKFVGQCWLEQEVELEPERKPRF